MSDKLPMTREQIEEEMSRCFPECLSSNAKNRIAVFTEHIVRICTTELREENKRLRELSSAVIAEIDDCADPGDWEFYGPLKEVLKK